MTTPTRTDSDPASTVATPGRRRQHAAPSQPDLAAKPRRRAGCQERAVRPRRRRPRRGDLYGRRVGATIIEVRWEGASANSARTTPRRHGRRRIPARTPLRSSLRTQTNEALHSRQRWVERRDRSVANSETPHRLGRRRAGAVADANQSGRRATPTTTIISPSSSPTTTS